MSNYPDDFDAAAHDARYAQADCLVDDWCKSLEADMLANEGAQYELAGDEASYRDTIEALDYIRETAFRDCNCGRCADSNNWATDGESLINDAMVSA